MRRPVCWPVAELKHRFMLYYLAMPFYVFHRIRLPRGRKLITAEYRLLQFSLNDGQPKVKKNCNLFEKTKRTGRPEASGE